MTLTLVRQSQHAHVLICSSCGEGCKRSCTDIEKPENSNPSRQLKNEIEKSLLDGQKPGWLVRVVESSCLDVCPVGAISVRLVGAEGVQNRVLTWTVKPEQDTERIIEELKKHLQRTA